MHNLLLAAVRVLEVLVHLAYLVHQALHRNPLSPAVPAVKRGVVICTCENLFKLTLSLSVIH